MKKLKKDNRGVSLVMVIAAIALVTVLVTVALTMGLWNYQMKATNRISKNNFYDAEECLLHVPYLKYLPLWSMFYG